MKRAIAFMVLMALAGCHRQTQKDDTSQKPKAAAAAKKVIKVDPAFTKIQGSWTSEPGSDGLPEGRYMQIDIASNGDYSMDIRKAKTATTPIQVFETAHGHASFEGSMLGGTINRGEKGPTIVATAPWRAEISSASKAMTLKGADGRSYHLKWDRL